MTCAHEERKSGDSCREGKQRLMDLRDVVNDMSRSRFSVPNNRDASAQPFQGNIRGRRRAGDMCRCNKQDIVLREG